MNGPATLANRFSAVLVLVDIQERLVTAMQDAPRVFEATALLTRVAAIVGMPIIVTRQYPKGLGDLSAEVSGLVAEAQSAGIGVTQVDKLTFDCFAEQTFVDAVSTTGRTQLVVAGMESHICVAQTILSALNKGFDVHVSADACCARSSTNHKLALARIARAGATVTCAESVAYELVGAAGTGEFKQLLAAVKGMQA